MVDLAVPAAFVEADSRKQERTAIRLGLPSKGRMAEETLTLLKVPLCSLWSALLLAPLYYFYASGAGFCRIVS